MERLTKIIIPLCLGILFLVLAFIFHPSPTGFGIYGDEQEPNGLNYTWDFLKVGDYFYNSSEILISDGQASLEPRITTSNWTGEIHEERGLIYALYNPDDKTNKINSIDNKKFKPSSNKILNVLFEEDLENGDVIIIHALSSDSTEIYLCGTNIICDTSNYGIVSYDGVDGIYNITISDLSFKTDSFNLIAPGVKIDYITSNRANITSVYYDPSDKLEKVHVRDNDKFSANKNHIFDIGFNSSLYNGDVVSFYLTPGPIQDFFLCRQSIDCSYPGYGYVSYDGGEGWYNLTLQDLPYEMSSFNINSDSNLKVDFISALAVDEINHTITNITYLSSANIETRDIRKIKSIKFLNFSNSLNNQSITYAYSPDSGVTWEEIPENLSSLNVSQIRFSATLHSDTFNTPVLESISLVYDKLFEEVYYELMGSLLVNITLEIPIIINSSNILLNLTTSGDIDNANITIKEFTNESLDFKKPLGSFIDLIVDDNTKEYLSSTKLKIYYTDEDIYSRNLNESTLRFYYYNESSQLWEELDSEVNAVDNYIQVDLSHFSIYGVFGDEISTPSTSLEDSVGIVGGGISGSMRLPGNTTENERQSQIEDISVNESSVSIEKERDGGRATGLSILGILIKELNRQNITFILIGIALAGGYVAYRSLKKHKRVTEELKNEEFL